MKRILLLIISLLAIFVILLPVIRQKFFTPLSSPRQQIVLTKVDRSFELTAKEKNGVKAEKIKFDLVSAEKVNQVARQGTPVKAPENQEFLILALELGNDTKETLYFSSAEVVRLLEGEKRFAPDFHNQTVEIMPLSVKKDEVAFLVPKGNKQFKIQIGDVEQEQKEEVKIQF